MGVITTGLRNVIRSPFRQSLIILLLGASLMFVAAMVSLNQSAQEQLQKVRSEVGTGITITYATENETQTNGNERPSNPNRGGNGTFNQFGQQNERTPIPQDTIDKVKKVAGVTGTEETLMRFDTDKVFATREIQTPNGSTRTIPASIYGISSGSTHFTIQGNTPTITAGRGFQTSDDTASVALMSQTLADTNKLKPGSTVTLKGSKITIIGLYTSDNPRTDNSLTLPLKTMQKLYNINGVDSITAYASTYDQVDSVATNLRNALGSKYNVVTENRLFSAAISSLSSAQNTIRLALMIAIAVSAAIIIFTVFIIVRERTIEIGTLKALGASHWQVIAQFWVEVFALSILASIVATLLLVLLGPIISQQFDISTAMTGQTPFMNGTMTASRQGRPAMGGFLQQLGNIHLASATLNTQTLLIIVGLGIGLAILTSIIPALAVARIRPAVVLRKGNN